MAKPVLRRALVASTLFFGLSAVSADQGSKDPRENLPSLAKTIGEESFEPLTVFRLQRPIVLWSAPNVNQEQRLRDYGFAAKLPYEPADAYTSETDVWWADRYGGVGMNGNFGSGRAAAKKEIQVKGPGRTKAVSDKADFWHSTGTMQTGEAIKEVIASQILNNELPYGANIADFIVATGTMLQNEHGHVTGPRVEMHRANPHRPAHHMLNVHAAEEPVGSYHYERDRARMHKALKNLADALPQPEGAIVPTDPAQRLRSGLNEFIDRNAKTVAFSYARKFFHSVATSSNAELHGGFLDLLEVYSFAGYPKAQAYEPIGAFGDETIILDDVVRDFLNDLRRTLTGDLLKAVPSDEEVRSRFDREYKKALQRELILLTGVPGELVGPWIDSPSSMKKLAETIFKISRAGNDQIVWMREIQPVHHGAYDLEKILVSLAKAADNSLHPEQLAKVLDQAILASLSDATLRAELVSGYIALLKQLESNSKGLTRAALRRYMVYAAEQRNKPIPELFGGGAFWYKYTPMIERFAQTSDPSEIRDSITKDIKNARRTFKDAAPFTIVLKETENEKTRSLERTVFDARANKLTKVIVRPSAVGGRSCRAALE